MSYLEAMRLAQEKEAELQAYRGNLQDNSVTNALNFGKNANIGLALGTGVSRAVMGMGAHQNSGLLHNLAPEAALMAAALLPMKSLGGLYADKKRASNISQHKKLFGSGTRNASLADMVNLGGSGSNIVSKAAMTAFMATTGAGMLAGDGLLGNSLKNMGSTAYGVSALTGGPLRALGALGGLFMNAPHAAGTAAPGFVSQSLSALPLMGLKAGGAALGGLGSLAGTLGAGTAGAHGTGLAGMLTGAGSAVGGFGATIAGLGPWALPLMGGLMMAGLNPIVSKGMAKFKEKSLVGGASNEVHSRRPMVTPAHMLEKQYSRTTFLDTQVNMLGQTGQIKSEWWLLLTGVMAIEKHTSLIRFLAEHVQEVQANKVQSGDTSRNAISSIFGQSGNKTLDLTKKFSGPLDPLAQFEDGSIRKWIAGKKNFVMKKMTSGFDLLDTASGFMSLGGLLSGGENSGIAKYRAKKKEGVYQEVLNKASSTLGIPTSFLTVLETSATSLIDAGMSSQDKMVTLLAGSYELQRFSAFKAQDLNNYLGIGEKESLMGKLDEMLKASEDNQDTTTETRGEAIRDWIARHPKLSALVGATAVGASGGMLGLGAGALGLGTAGAGALFGAKLGAGASMLTSWGSNLSLLRRDLKKRKDREILGAKDAVDAINAEDMLPDIGTGLNTHVSTSVSIDASQVKLKLQREKAYDRQRKLLGITKIVALEKRFKRVMTDEVKGVPIYFSKTGLEQLQDTRCCEGGGSGDDIDVGGGVGGSGGRRSRRKGSRWRQTRRTLNRNKGLVRGAGVLGALSLGYSMTQEDYGDKDLLGGMSDMLGGASAGAMLGSFAGPVGMLVGGAIGGVLAGVTSMYGSEIKKWWAEETDKDIIKKNKERKSRNSGTAIENNGANLQNVVGGKGHGANQGGHVTGQATVVNPRGHHKKADTGVIVMGGPITSKAQEIIDLKSKGIASMGGDLEKVDTPEEIKALLHVMLAMVKDQQQIGQVTTGQQSSMMEILSTMVEVSGSGSQEIARMLASIDHTLNTSKQEIGNK